MLPFCWLLQMHTRTQKIIWISEKKNIQTIIKITNHINQIKNGQFFQMFFSPKKTSVLSRNSHTRCLNWFVIQYFLLPAYNNTNYCCAFNICSLAVVPFVLFFYLQFHIYKQQQISQKLCHKKLCCSKEIKWNFFIFYVFVWDNNMQNNEEPKKQKQYSTILFLYFCAAFFI